MPEYQFDVVMPRIVAIIQARMGSTRLPGKVLMNVGSKTILAHLIERLKRVPIVNEIVVATTTKPQDLPIEQLCKKLSIPIYRGDEKDVLGRYLEAARLFKAEVVIRSTADEPYNDPQIMHQFLQAHLTKQADYTCNNFPRTFPYGSTVEIVNFPALERVTQLGKRPPDREHVTFYIHHHPQEFTIQNIEATGKLRRPDIRYCVDTEEDLTLVRAIDAHLGNTHPYFTMEQIIDFLDQHDEIRQINRGTCQKIATY